MRGSCRRPPRRPPSASGVSMSTRGRRSSASTSTTRAGMLADQVPGTRHRPRRLCISCEERARPTGPGCRACRDRSARRCRAALDRVEGGDQAVDQARGRPAACRRGRPRAPATSAGSGGEAGPQGGAEALARSRGCATKRTLQPAQGLADLMLLVARAPRPPAPAREASAASTTWRTIGLPATGEQQLVGAAHAPRLAAGQHHGGDPRPAAPRPSSLARLRPRGDLAQQPAHAHPHDVAGR